MGFDIVLEHPAPKIERETNEKIETWAGLDLLSR